LFSRRSFSGWVLERDGTVDRFEAAVPGTIWPFASHLPRTRSSLIGEHTDYNDGFVMPAAIHLSTWVAIAPRQDGRVVVHSENFSETLELVDEAGDGWSQYVLGVARVLELQGANLLVYTELPIGAGLSSSAALEVAVGYALLNISGIDLDRTDLARACQRAEHEFAGVRCGIMDQMVACHGRAQHALLLDTRSLEYELVALPDDVTVVVCNTMVKHNLAATEYNTRRTECETAARIFGRSLRDVTLSDLEKRRIELGENIYRRARHVVTENARVQSAALALKHKNLHEFGRLMYESHRSLRDDYEVSCRELDIMTKIASSLDGVYGARMTGGGFGGCTVSFVVTAAVERFRAEITEQYKNATGLLPDVYVCTPASGAEEETNPPLKSLPQRCLHHSR
jgi:galactokinase